MKKLLLIALLFLIGCSGVYESELITTASETFNIPTTFISSNGVTTIDFNPLQNTIKNTTVQSMTYSILNNTGGAGTVDITYTTQAMPCAGIVPQATIPITAGVNNSGVMPASFIASVNASIIGLNPYRMCISVLSTNTANPVMTDLKIDMVIRSIIRVEG